MMTVRLLEKAKRAWSLLLQQGFLLKGDDGNDSYDRILHYLGEPAELRFVVFLPLRLRLLDSSWMNRESLRWL